MMVTILSPGSVQPYNPGVEIVGAGNAGSGPLGVREGSNTIVRYCRPPDAAAKDVWIGVFAAGTPASQMTKDNANLIGNWLRTPGDQGSACGEAQAYSSELTAGTTYQVSLFRAAGNGTATAVGHSAAFTLTPALPH